MFGRTWFQIDKGRETLIFALLRSSRAPSIFPVPSPCSLHPISSYFPFSSLLNPFPQIFGQYQTLSCSTSRICSIALSSRLTIRPPCHLQPSSPPIHIMYLLPSRPVSDSSFSALTLKITIVGQIMLLKKTTGCSWRRNRKLPWESGKMQKGG